jgi:hypothetical protein
VSGDLRSDQVGGRETRAQRRSETALGGAANGERQLHVHFTPTKNTFTEQVPACRNMSDRFVDFTIVGSDQLHAAR